MNALMKIIKIMNSLKISNRFYKMVIIVGLKKKWKLNMMMQGVKERNSWNMLRV